MRPVAATAAQIAYWADRDGAAQSPAVIGGPGEGPDVTPCPALVAPAAGLVHVAYELDEIELVRLAHGGTLWLSAWGGLPVHLVEVVGTEE